MPCYEYECEKCGVRFERVQGFSEEPVRTCPECGGAVHRLIQPVGIVFKGKGFYVTDNRSSSRASTTSSSDGGSSSKGSSSKKSSSD